MNPHSAKALAWAAGLLIILSLALLSPTAAFAAGVLAAICAAIPSAFAIGRTRLVAVLLLITAFALVAVLFPAFRRDQEAYRRRAREQAPGQVHAMANHDPARMTGLPSRPGRTRPRPLGPYRAHPGDSRPGALVRGDQGG